MANRKGVKKEGKDDKGNTEVYEGQVRGKDGREEGNEGNVRVEAVRGREEGGRQGVVGRGVK